MHQMLYSQKEADLARSQLRAEQKSHCVEMTARIFQGLGNYSDEIQSGLSIVEHAETLRKYIYGDRYIPDDPS